MDVLRSYLDLRIYYYFFFFVFFWKCFIFCDHFFVCLFVSIRLKRSHNQRVTNHKVFVSSSSFFIHFIFNLIGFWTFLFFVFHSPFVLILLQYVLWKNLNYTFYELGEKKNCFFFYLILQYHFTNRYLFIYRAQSSSAYE